MRPWLLLTAHNRNYRHKRSQPLLHDCMFCVFLSRNKRRWIRSSEYWQLVRRRSINLRTWLHKKPLQQQHLFYVLSRRLMHLVFRFTGTTGIRLSGHFFSLCRRAGTRSSAISCRTEVIFSVTCAVSQIGLRPKYADTTFISTRQLHRSSAVTASTGQKSATR